MNIKKLLPGVAITAALSCFSAHAADYRWNGSSSSFTIPGNWQVFDGENWILATSAPGASDRIVTPNNFGILNIDTFATVAEFNVDMDTGWVIRNQVTDSLRSLTVSGDFTKAGSAALQVRDSNGPLNLSIGGALNANEGSTIFGIQSTGLNSLSVTGTTTVASGATLRINAVTSTLGAVQMNGGILGVFDSGSADASGGTTVSSLSGSGSVAARVTASTVAITGTLAINGSSGSTTFSGLIADSTLGSNAVLNVTKAGNSTQVFSGANTYTGGTQVNGGTLLIANTTGSGTGTGAITVASGARFGGTGIATGAVTVSSFDSVIIAGGENAIGTLTLNGGLTANSGVTFAFDINGAQIDSIDFGTASLNLGGTVTVDFTSLGSVETGVAYSLFAGTGAWDSVSASFVINGPSGYELDTSYGGGNGYIFDDATNSFTVQFAAIPEPSTYAALFGGLTLAGAALTRRRRA
ncbi:MAG: autotransporter-associated beta strand repeat-containing protein [Verrucomicrobiota bacterium]